MPAVARTGDIGTGICYNHPVPTPYTTVFTSDITTVSANGESVCVIGTVGVATCGHTTVAYTGSSTVSANGIGVHRVDDTGANFGPYTVVSGSEDVNAGG